MSAAALANIAELEALIAAMQARVAKMRTEAAGSVNDNAVVRLAKAVPTDDDFIELRRLRSRRGRQHG